MDGRTYARIGHFYPINSLEIAILAWGKQKKHIESIARLRKMGSEIIDGEEVYFESEKIHLFKNAALHQTIVSVTFLHSFLESYFYELSSIILGDKFTRDHIEKLDTLSKIILVPKLCFNGDLDKSHHSFQYIKEIITWRNKIIHNKTKDFHQFLENHIRNNSIPKSEVLYEKIELYKFFQSVEDLMKKLDSIDKDDHHYLKWSFAFENVKKAEEINI